MWIPDWIGNGFRQFHLLMNQNKWAVITSRKRDSVASLQYVIDSLCSKITVEALYRMIKLRLSQGPFSASEIIPLVQSEDRSLDHDSAKMLANAAFLDLAQLGEIRIDGDRIQPAA